jgi:hypothetical protein
MASSFDFGGLVKRRLQVFAVLFTRSFAFDIYGYSFRHRFPLTLRASDNSCKELSAFTHLSGANIRETSEGSMVCYGSGQERAEGHLIAHEAL